ncbi:carbohydrate ABC transporter permease [uncultured Pseudokineococcus sp.]|uniref:carbohydrate ABC transporter permease n=1 Tax=uncultured Pseudokineococcus sp. TaxID=1642928 RepID=UPI002627729D|nr:sugar ABC transporter permease [uncultured Pseudokineococcus sp.]
MTTVTQAVREREQGRDVQEPRAPRSRRRRAEDVAGYSFLLPWLLGFFLLTAGPMLASLYLSFTRYDLFNAPQWVGLDNFRELFSDPRYRDSVRVTTVFAVVGVPIKLAASLAVAMLLNAALGAKGFYRSAFYLPSLVGASVSIAIVWRAMFNDGGIVDQISQGVGGEAGGWIGDPTRTMPMFILLAVWQFGAPMVIFLAGLKQVPAELYEAASVDGAGPLRRFLSITLPMLSPVIFFNLLLETINAFQVFASAYIISNGTGGPANSTLFYTLYLYRRGFEDFEMGYASAMAWLLVLVVGAITFVFFKTSKSWVHYSGETR